MLLPNFISFIFLTFDFVLSVISLVTAISRLWDVFSCGMVMWYVVTKIQTPYDRLLKAYGLPPIAHRPAPTAHRPPPTTHHPLITHSSPTIYAPSHCHHHCKSQVYGELDPSLCNGTSFTVGRRYAFDRLVSGLNARLEHATSFADGHGCFRPT